MGNVQQSRQSISGRNLSLAILLNTGITLAEALGGIISGSMALLSDAAHNFSDVIALIVSYFANILSRREATEKETFGFRRSEILAAFINSATLLIIAVVIIVEAVQRLINPVIVSAGWVIGLAAASILVNGLSALFIRKDAHDNLNIRSAYIHLFTDMLTSVAVLTGGLAMKYLHWYRMDPIFSLIISGYLLYLTWGILRSSIRIIMEFTPEKVDVRKIACSIGEIPGVKNIHHIHVWQINDRDLMFEAHIDITDDIMISGFEKILEEIKVILRSNGITHSTIQPEYSIDDSKQMIH